ncbi:deoxyribose-phosphate aldolase [Lachnospiraceae bacterium OttesenSCG-928-J05]|nr:deoxyribose-phosphate aldolase [Lachnospiraceae bacterium OttesenSCG-928-J05]
MDIKEILRHVDHTVLKPTATKEDIRALIDEGIAYQVASVCIPPSFVKEAAAYAAGRLPICTVIGFPNGYNTCASKVSETKDAVLNGADEVDMVINLGDVKSGDFEKVLAEIKAVKAGAGGKLLKVIIECSELTEAEKIKLCEVVSASGADFIKTSTGFASGGATFADVELMVKNVGKDVQVKAAGGIKSIADAQRFLSLGAERLGSSSVIKLAKEEGLL